jgi:hypothetical protein
MSLARQIVGTWELVSSVDIHPDGSRTDTWGPAPRGTYMFDGAGRFAQIVMRAELPKAPSRESTTPEQAKAIVSGSLAMFGTYRVDEAASTIDVHFLACTFAGFTGTDGKRKVEMLSGDEMRFRNAGRVGGSTGESVWRRVR